MTHEIENTNLKQKIKLATKSVVKNYFAERALYHDSMEIEIAEQVILVIKKELLPIFDTIYKEFLI